MIFNTHIPWRPFYCKLDTVLSKNEHARKGLESNMRVYRCGYSTASILKHATYYQKVKDTFRIYVFHIHLLQFDPMHIYSEESPNELNGINSQASVCRTAALGHNPEQLWQLLRRCSYGTTY